MSHELRTPLNAVLGFSEVMRDERLGTMANPAYREYAADIHDSGTHLLSLIDGLLDVAKIEAGRYELHETRLDLRSVIERAVRTVQPVAARKAQTIAMEVPEPAHVVLADERALHQILLNLLSNAIKFSYSGGVIELRVTLPAEGITITVEDHGIGIPPDQIADVGKPFFQAHAQTARIAGGTGIGLTVTRSLVDLHGGTLAVTSEYGHGTCVTIGLPAARLASRAKPSAA
jgi:signal transduction histidine kinase